MGQRVLLVELPLESEYRAELKAQQDEEIRLWREEQEKIHADS